MSPKNIPRRYSYQSGQNLPGDGNPTRDIEAQEDGKKTAEKKKRGCCCCGCGGCCCCCLIFTLIFIAFIVIAGIVLFPKKPKIKQVSLDITKSAVYEIDSPNKYDIKLNRVFGEVTFKGDALVNFEVKDVNIRKKAKTNVEIPLKPKLSPELLNHCASNKDFKAEIKITVEPALLAWLKKSITKKEQVTFPCPKIPKEIKDIPPEVLQNLPKDIPPDLLSKLPQDLAT